MAEAKTASPDTTEDAAQETPSRSRWTIQRATILAVSIFVAIYLLVFGCGFVAAVFWNGAAPFFSYLRDLVTIALAVSSVIIIVGIGILIIQIARFINLLRSEVKPITEETKATIRTVRTTAEFVQKHAVEPIIQVSSFISGLLTFLWEIVQISRMLQQRDEQDKASEDEDSSPAADIEADNGANGDIHPPIL